MKYIYKAALTPSDMSLLSQLDLAAVRLHEKLVNTNLEKLNISEYVRRHLTLKLADPHGTFQLYTYLLSLAFRGTKKPFSEVVFVDYGGGCGILSLLAKELGVGRVIYNDIYEVSCRDLSVLEKAIGIQAEDHVCGDIDELISYLGTQNVSIDAICSYDVIEHIYDIKNYLKKLSRLGGESLRVVFGSGANSKNPIIRWRLRKIHEESEYQDRSKKRGHKERDSLRSFFSIRQEIIQQYDRSLNAQIVEHLARKTRGLMKKDIETCVEEFKRCGTIAYEPSHPTNTCDPCTGNWAEQLIDPEVFEVVLREEGFDVQVLGGYWQQGTTALKACIKDMVNWGIKLFQKKMLLLSPYYIVYGELSVATRRQWSRPPGP